MEYTSQLHQWKSLCRYVLDLICAIAASRASPQVCSPVRFKAIRTSQKSSREDLNPETYNYFQKNLTHVSLSRTIPEDYSSHSGRINERVFMDVTYPKSWSVIHIVDDFARFFSARFLTYIYTKKICKTLLECWPSTCKGFLNNTRFD